MLTRPSIVTADNSQRSTNGGNTPANAFAAVPADWITIKHMVSTPPAWVYDDWRGIEIYGDNGVSITIQWLNPEDHEYLAEISVSREDFLFNDGNMGAKLETSEQIYWINGDIYATVWITGDLRAAFNDNEEIITAVVRTLTDYTPEEQMLNAIKRWRGGISETESMIGVLQVEETNSQYINVLADVTFDGDDWGSLQYFRIGINGPTDYFVAVTLIPESGFDIWFASETEEINFERNGGWESYDVFMDAYYDIINSNNYVLGNEPQANNPAAGAATPVIPQSRAIYTRWVERGAVLITPSPTESAVNIQYNRKCESCGNIPRQTYSFNGRGLVTSFRCSECNTTQRVEIKHSVRYE
jgi:hypothetical protein